MPLTAEQIQERLLAGLAGFYFTGTESLRITSLNSASSVVVALSGRFLDVGNLAPSDLAYAHTPNTDRTSASSDFRMGAGWLQSLSLIASSGTPLSGQTFVRVDIVRGGDTSATVVATLLQGFVTAAQRLAWPGSRPHATIERPGAIRTITGTDPAAGAEISETVPTGARWRILAVEALLIADATVANREPALVLDNGTSQFANASRGATQGASTLFRHSWYETAARFTVVSHGMSNTPLPPAILLAGYRLRTSTSALQAGDNWGAPVLLVEEWLEGA